MTTVWILVAVLFAGTVALKAVGPVTFGERPLSDRTAAVIGLVAPALLAALVVYEALTSGGAGIALDARVAGLAAAAVALDRPMLVVVFAAAATTAAVRALAIG
jgi:uncharacterized membrane protein